MTRWQEIKEERGYEPKDQAPKPGANRPRIIWGQRLGKPECPYMRRWVINFGLFAIRLHHWVGSDDPRYLHDHPWWFITAVLKGGYTDVSAPDPSKLDFGSDLWVVHRSRLRSGSIRFRPAHHIHTVQVNPGGCWTLLITGRETRRFGYWVKGKWMNAKRYFLKIGLHPCE